MIRIVFVVIVVCAMMSESSALTVNRPRRRGEICGIPKSKLGQTVHGQYFPHGSFPWIVALMYAGTTPPKYFCAGTLISKTFVISAAHCFIDKGGCEKYQNSDIRAIFGAHDLNSLYESERIELSPSKIFIHDDWNQFTSNYDADVSLLEFWANRIIFNEFIQPICLWNSDDEPTVTERMATSWRNPEDPSKIHENKPKLITVPVQSQKECFSDAKVLVALSSRRTFCAELRNGSEVCSGDSGGGLFIEVDKVFHLKGIVLSSLTKDDGCDVLENAVYTNVLEFSDWIADVTGIALVSSKQAVKKVFCTSKMDSFCCETCRINQTIDSEDYVLGSEIDTAVKSFDIFDKEDVKFLPGLIGDKLPNLEDFAVAGCGLTVLRNHYFKGMEKLQFLSLFKNKITKIESVSFKHLIKVKYLWLYGNMIETLDKKLFTKMVSLKTLDLKGNKIRFLSSTMPYIPGNRLEKVDLRSNVCIDGFYDSRNPYGWKDWHDPDNWEQLEADINANCTRCPDLKSRS